MLFADVSGFTALTERLSKSGGRGVETLTDQLNQYFSGLLDAVFHFHGDVLKFGGDALLVAFDHEGRHQDALDCARQMHLATAGFNRKSGRGFHLRLHVGLASGTLHEVVMGSNERERCEHFVLGDAIRNCLDAADHAEGGETIIAGQLAVWKDSLIRVKESGRLQEKKRDKRALRVLTVPKSQRNISFAPANPSEVQPPTCDVDIEHPRQWLWNFIDPALREIVQAQPQGPFGAGSGEHRQATTVFVFWKGSDAWQHQSTSQAQQTWKSFFAIVQECCSEHDGYWLRSDPGDSYQKLLVLFGAPRSEADDTVRAVAFGKTLMERMRDFAQQHPEFSARCGITTGGVFAGFVGDRRRFEYTVMGKPVNLAARLAAKAPPFTVWADGATADSVAAHFAFASDSPLKLKGVSQRMRPQRLLGRVERQPPAPLDLNSVDYYGDELETVQGWMTDSELPLSIRIRSQAGGGRTRFLRQLLRRVSGAHVVIDCHFEERRLPFSAVQRFLVAAFNRHSVSLGPTGQTAMDGEQALGKAIARRGRDLVVQDLRDEIQAILIGSDKTPPLVCAFDDWHWADEVSREVLGPFLTAGVRGKFRVIWTERIDENPSVVEDSIKSVSLAGVSHERFVRCVNGLLDNGRASDDMVKLLWQKSGGHPVFAAQLIDDMRECGDLLPPARGGAPWRCKPSAKLHLPDSLRATFVRRLDRLDHDGQAIVRAAAVWGGGDWTTHDIATVLGEPWTARSVISIAEHLIHSGFFESSQDIGPEVHKTRSPATHYRFARPLMRQVAYDTMSFAQRRFLHQKAAAICAKRSGNWRERTAEHYFYAEIPQKAAPALTEAASRAEMLGALDNAREYIRRAIMARRGRFDPAREPAVPGGRIVAGDAELLFTLGRLSHALGRYDDARNAFARSVVAARRRNGLDLAGRAELEHARVDWTQGRYNRTSRTISTLLKTHLSPALRARTLTLRGELLRRRGKFSDAAATLGEAERLVNDDPRAALEILNSQGLVSWNRGQLDEAVAFYQRALKLPRRVIGPAQHGQIANNLGIIHQERARLSLAARFFQRAFNEFERIGHRRNRAYCLGNLANIWRAQARFEHARSAYEETANVCAEIGESHAGAYTTGNLGDLYFDFGCDEAAKHNFESALAFARRADDLELQAECECRLAALFLRARQWRPFNAHVEAARDAAQQCGSAEFALYARSLSADYLNLHGKNSDAMAEYVAILDKAERDGLWLFVLWSWYGLVTTPGHDGARDFLRQGLKLSRTSGYKWWELRFALADQRQSTSGRRASRVDRPLRIVTEVASTIGDRAVAERFEQIAEIRLARQLKNGITIQGHCS